MKYLKIFCIFMLSAQFVYSDNIVNNDDNDNYISHHAVPSEDHRGDAEPKHHRRHRHSYKRCQLGVASFSTMDSADWYTISVPSYPDSVPLSLNRNAGFTEGNIELTPTGIKINEPGNYSVSFTAVLLNPSSVDGILVPVFVVKNNLFDPINNPAALGNIVVLSPDGIGTVTQTSILPNVEAGTELSLVATNGSGPDIRDLTVIAWNISIFKIPCVSCNK